MQDVPKGADHAPARTFYTWHIDRSSVTKRMAAELIQAAGNLRARLHHELSNHAEVNKLFPSRAINTGMILSSISLAPSIGCVRQ